MRYMVQFQQFNPQSGRPTDWPTGSDFETDDNGFGMIPNVGDYVHIIAMKEGEADFSGRVRTRLFRYFGDGDNTTQSCAVNIVVEPGHDNVWGELIKE